MTMRMLGFRDDMAADEKEQLFYDVEPGAMARATWTRPITRVSSLGTETDFSEQDKNITVNEALSMLLRAMNTT